MQASKKFLYQVSISVIYSCNKLSECPESRFSADGDNRLDW